MAHNLLPIRILFHAAFTFVYLSAIVLGFTSGLDAQSNGDGELTFVQKHFEGITSLAALVGLGIFAALDILTIRRMVNQRAFLIIEITVVVLLPLSMWPMIISSISVVWLYGFLTFIFEPCFTADGSLVSSWFCSGISLIVIPSDEATSASIVAAIVAVLALNAAFFLYICMAAVTDKYHGHKFLPIYPGAPSLPSPGTKKKWYLFGTPRTPKERAAMVSHCTDYIFRNSVFRKHSFEPAIWAIFRGTIAVYSCLGLVAFSAYAALSEAQLRGTLTVNEHLSMASDYDTFLSFGNLSVASFLVVPPSIPHHFMNVNPEQNPPPMLSGTTGQEWPSPTRGFWTTDTISTFNITWTGEYSLVTWVTSDGGLCGTGNFNSTQVNSTNPVVLAPFQQYYISLIGIVYYFPECEFTLWIPDIVRSVDSVSGFNTSVAMFSFNAYCQQQILVREITTTSIFASVAHVISAIGGTLSAIDGLFALVFGRTVMAILFGTRMISPFGLLGMVTRNRFKRLIHEQYPHMQEDIEHGGMAAYISEVAIDAALMDAPSAKGSTSPSHIEDETGGGDAMELRHRQTGSSES
ncbi:hypothetical protein FIBSPDRAFT_1054398 [Athelia psychrophila]|uniref:Uncharacterized protein n=1 Tax=Athelia psychrophila TaxID=1759441 RepID=A0A167VDB1_9AGAM|nr:hypothetical protein FIBSPDRAFT_1054398 [Fibularhizoctonia sp. CBS 109695]